MDARVFQLGTVIIQKGGGNIATVEKWPDLKRYTVTEKELLSIV